ncbi:MAG: acyltransferase [Acetobacteraceae bacterium]|nr:MAG: acyltransferase [Acetobacteraceae bacterium]
MRSVPGTASGTDRSAAGGNRMTLSGQADGTTRDVSMDVAKGVGIILVVIGHAWRGLNTAGLIGDDRLYQLIDRVIYNFHMPLFFILSGMTFQSWALRRPVGEAATSRITRLLWPLILWTYLFAAARLAAGDAANTQLDGWQNLAFWPLPPRDHFWFLWALFLQHLAVLALIRFVTGPLSAPAWALLAGVVLVASSFIPFGLHEWTHGAFTYASAFLAGLALGGMRWRPNGVLAFAVAAVLFVGLQVLSFHVPHILVTRQLLGIALSLLALAMIHILTSGGTSSVIRLLTWLGLSSMGIYLSHTIFSAGARAVLGRFTQDLSLHMIAGTLIGIIGPLILYAIIRRVGRPSWIGF